ncbi:MAG: NAD(P)-dependent oxidoreductase [Desulfopila sp.]
MKLLIIGASRGIGAELCKQALAADHEVTVLARRPAAIPCAAPLTVLEGDIRDHQAVNAAVQGRDAVCLTIGVPITFATVTVFSAGTRNVLMAMQEHGVKRLVCVTGIGAGDSRGHGGFLYDRIFKPLFLKTIYQDKDLQERYIAASDRLWTIVRPAGLTNGPRTGDYRVLTDLHGVTATRISRADVADFILVELLRGTYIGQTPLLMYG